MSTKEIFNIFLLISSLHGFLFYFVILFSKEKKDKSIFYINLLVLVMSLNNLQSWLFNKVFFTDYSFTEYLHFPWYFLIAPLFYTFLIYYLTIEKKSTNLLKITIPIFLLMILIRISFVYYFNNYNNTDVTYLFTKYNSIEEIIGLITSIIIFSYSFHILSKKEKLFTKILSFDNLSWIYTFFKVGAITYIFWIISLTITIALDFKEIIYTYFPLRVLTTILIYLIGYQAIIQLRLLKERKGIRKLLYIEEKTNDDSQIIQEKDADKKALFDTLNTLLNEQKLFTEPKLNVEFLANELDISSNKLSTIIKQYAEKNFNDFINEYRISLAKDLLTHKEYKTYTITSIGLESGFNSKSTFYATFKKHTGLTPVAYQKSLMI